MFQLLIPSTPKILDVILNTHSLTAPYPRPVLITLDNPTLLTNFMTTKKAHPLAGTTEEVL